jgi:hypothetical protein
MYLCFLKCFAFELFVNILVLRRENTKQKTKILTDGAKDFHPAIQPGKVLNKIFTSEHSWKNNHRKTEQLNTYHTLNHI